MDVILICVDKHNSNILHPIINHNRRLTVLHSLLQIRLQLRLLLRPRPAHSSRSGRCAAEEQLARSSQPHHILLKVRRRRCHGMRVGI